MPTLLRQSFTRDFNPYNNYGSLAYEAVAGETNYVVHLQTSGTLRTVWYHRLGSQTCLEQVYIAPQLAEMLEQAIYLGTEEAVYSFFWELKRVYGVTGSLIDLVLSTLLASRDVHEGRARQEFQRRGDLAVL